MKVKKYSKQIDRRRAKIRASVSGTKKIPRMRVFKSNRNIYAQLIDDLKGNTLLSLDDRGIKGENKVEKAFKLGQELAKKAISEKITKVVFDRGGYIYQGRIKSLAEGAREAGLKF